MWRVSLIYCDSILHIISDLTTYKSEFQFDVENFVVNKIILSQEILPTAL